MAHAFPYPSTLQAEAFLSELGYVIEEILAGLVFYQPDRPSAFIKAFANNKVYEGDMRGEAVFNNESAQMYMKILAGPIIAEILERLLQLSADNRPKNKNSLLAWINQNIDAIGAKIDQASVRIASSVKGIAARKRVSRMKADPVIRDRANAAIASGSYGTGASSKAKAKAARRASVDIGTGNNTGAVLATDTNRSTVGRGEEKQVTVDEAAFEEYIRKQAEIQKEAEAAAALAAAEAAALEAATKENNEQSSTSTEAGEATTTNTETTAETTTATTEAVAPETTVTAEPEQAPPTPATSTEPEASSSTTTTTTTEPVPTATESTPTVTEEAAPVVTEEAAPTTETTPETPAS